MGCCILGGQGAGSCRARPLDWYPLLIARLWVMVWCESGRVDLDILCQNTARPRSTVCVYDGCVWQSHLKQKKALSSNCNLTRLVILYWAYALRAPLARGTARPPSPQMRSRSLVSSRGFCTTDAPQHHPEPAVYHR